MCRALIQVKPLVLDVAIEPAWEYSEGRCPSESHLGTIKLIAILGIIFFSVFSESLLVFVLSFGLGFRFSSVGEQIIVFSSLGCISLGVMYQATNNRDLESGGAVYVEDQKAPLSSLLSVDVRHGFIRKVYSILFVQLLLTCGIAAPFVLMDTSTIQTFVKANVWLLWTSLGLSFTFMIIFACFPSLMRSYPWNYGILLLFTATQGLFVGLICATYTVQSVLVAVVTVTGITLALSLFALQTKWDFTGWGPYLLVATLVLLVFGLFVALFPNEIAHKVYAGIGALLFSFYLVYDTQMIAGGNHRKHQFSVDDYAMAAICLYIDIIQLFLYILALFGNRR